MRNGIEPLPDNIFLPRVGAQYGVINLFCNIHVVLHFYPLIPPCATAVTMYFLAKKNSTTMGITTINAAAISLS